MITHERLIATLRPGEKGILTQAEVQARIDQGNQAVLNIGTVGHSPSHYFFTDTYSFGVEVLPPHYVRSCAVLPFQVVQQPGLENGIVDTLDKLIFLFNQDDQRIETMEELVTLANQRSRNALPVIKPQPVLFQSEPLLKAQSRYVVYRLTELVPHLLRHDTSSTQVYDHLALTRALKKQSFVKVRRELKPFTSYVLTNLVYLLDKKRTQRWLQQNKHRFLLSKKTQAQRNADYKENGFFNSQTWHDLRSLDAPSPLL